jgi:putative ABC transport system permease protein
VGPAGLAASQAEMREIARRLEALHPDKNTGFSAIAPPLQAYMTGDVRRPLLVMMGGVAFVALIACANVAALLLVRGAARAREMAVRSALGAGRGRLVRQLVTESLVLGLLGGALGLALAVWGTRAFVALAPADIPRLDDVAVDGSALAVTALAALAAGLLFGLLPALHASAGGGGALARAIRDGGRGGADRGGTRARSALVVAEVALAVALLAGAGLLARSFAELLRVDVGLQRIEEVTTFSVSLPDAAYPDEAAGRTFTRSLLERVERIPGVRAAGAVSGLPLTGSYFFLGFTVGGRPAPRPGEEPSAVVRFATPGYFTAVGLPVVRGRAFSERDRAGAPTVFLINREAARRYFPGEDPLGRRLEMGWRASDGQRMAGEIVGVVGNVKQFALGEEPTADVYVPADQWPRSDLTVVMRAEPGAAVAAAARAAVREVDPGLPVFGMRTLDRVVAESVARPRFYMTVLGAFALVALLLAAVGIYGVLSYAVGRRVREIGLRVALGATRGRVVRMVVRQGIALAALGAALGVGGALWLSRAMAGLLFGVAPGDPLTFAGVVALFLAVAGLACLVPALRAARVDPAVALRSE